MYSQKQKKIKCCYQSLWVMCANDLLELLMFRWLNTDYRMHLFFCLVVFQFSALNKSLYTVRYNEVGKSEMSLEQRKKILQLINRILRNERK